MRPQRVAVRNVRGALDLRLHLREFSALIGPNNAGKSTVLDAVRLFYGSLEWEAARDLPWQMPEGEESWVEIDYEVSPTEAEQIFQEPAEGGSVRIRRWLAGGAEHKDGAYYLIPADGGDPQPTGWDTAARLGQCVYVPTLAQMSDHTSLSDPSPLRDVLLLAFSERYTDGLLMGVRRTLGALGEALAEGPITALESDLDEALSPWGLSVKVDVGELSNELIMRNLIELQLRQDGTQRQVETQGSGVQRALVAALIQAAAKLRSVAKENAFRWILFEEPEAFLHPAQVTRLSQDLRELIASGNTAVTITTHDPTMLSAVETSPEAIARVQRRLHRVEAVSPTPDEVRTALSTIHTRSAYAMGSRSCFKTVRQTAADEERQRVLYDMDARRAAAFFADRVLVVEGPSDVLFFEWLSRRGLMSRLGPNVGILDSFGKFELHRVSTTLSLFGIPHVVLWDQDSAMPTSDSNKLKTRICQDEAALIALSAASHDAGSAFSGAVRLTGTIEHWLGINEEHDGPWKAANIGASLTQAYADPASPMPGRVGRLLSLLTDLFDGVDPGPHRTLPEFQGALIERQLPQPILDLAVEVTTFPRARCGCPTP
ncbi:AAA family ATPase [Actinomadura barringtoniae]|uniref:AAA family ATPase n=1 Tax=Actinomadura barringtoniae TaxID=1427535 RepID=A0A939P7R7_9ACTN|nr:ATP-binding protein [Actinomadura barringtoniae]MBO2447105.1 AAA family ATPase [Actinomadura barringtoniae]